MRAVDARTVDSVVVMVEVSSLSKIGVTSFFKGLSFAAVALDARDFRGVITRFPGDIERVDRLRVPVDGGADDVTEPASDSAGRKNGGGGVMPRLR